MEDKEILERAGLTTNEAKTYLEILNYGSLTASDVAKKSQLHRRPVYDALNRLVEKGLVSYSVKNNKKYFYSVNPNKLLETIKEKERELNSLLPNLIAKFNETKPSVFVQVYEGKEGLKGVMELILEEKKGWFSIGSTGKGPETLPYFLETWHKRRLKLKIKLKSLVANTKNGLKRGKEFLNIGLSKVKVLPREINQPQTIWIFGNKVAIILVSVAHPIVFLVDNKEIANSFMDYFNWMWKKSKTL